MVTQLRCRGEKEGVQEEGVGGQAMGWKRKTGAGPGDLRCHE